jgi:acetyltransferase-like isoleucine patch superfamily enzyme
MRDFSKYTLNLLAQLFALPFAFTCWLEKNLSSRSESIFSFWTHVFALLPGIPGVFLRRGFYSLTLDRCTLNCHIGFGTIFAHRAVIVEENVYLGIYCTIGAAHLGKHCLIGSHASLLSGSAQHTRDEETGEWLAFSSSDMVQINVAANVWVGEGAIIMADIGQGSLIAAGAVINTNVKENVVMAGNPARFVKHFAPLPDNDEAQESEKSPNQLTSKHP